MHDYISKEEIMNRLGLEDFDSFRLKRYQEILNSNLSNAQKNEFIENKYRCGRSTELIVNAIYQSQFHEKIYVRSFSQEATDRLIRLINDKSVFLGISNNIIDLHPDSVIKFNLSDYGKVFFFDSR